MYYNKKTEEVFEELKTSTLGLKQNEIEKREKKYGKNILPKKQKESILITFLKCFKNPIIILLLLILTCWLV